MAANSSIEWTNATWNPWQGCTKVSPACTNCYMFADLKRYGRDPSIVVRSKPPTFRMPLKRRRGGEYALSPGWKVFTCSWSDWFHQSADGWRDEAWEIVRSRPDLTFQILTKRPERILEHLPADWGAGWPNVWLGTTVEDQQRAQERIPWMIKVPAVVRFLSCEPLLGPVRFCSCFICDNMTPSGDCRNCGRFTIAGGFFKWVICGGESGSNSRPMHPQWARDLLGQCKTDGVAYFFKQWGEWAECNSAQYAGCPDSKRVFWGPDAGLHDWRTGDLPRSPEDIAAGQPSSVVLTKMARIGKVAAGRILDGREWNEFPRTEPAIV